MLRSTQRKLIQSALAQAAAGQTQVANTQSSLAAAVSNDAYNATSWNGVTGVAPSKDAVRDKLVAMEAATPTGNKAFTDTSGALSVESTVADGGNAFTFDTSGALTSGKLGVIANNGVNKLSIVYTGGLVFHDETADEPIVSGAAVSATGGFQVFSVTSQYNGAGAQGSLTTDVYADYCSLTHAIDAKGVSWAVAPSSVSFTVGWSVGKEFTANPTAAASATAYTLGTEVEHTSGKVLDLLNNGTSIFAVDFAGRMIAPSAPPANASAAGVAGSITWDADYIYICTATNTWKRVAIATW